MARLTGLKLFAFIIVALRTVSAQVSLYKPCPLLGPFFPTPLVDPTLPVVATAFGAFTKYIDSYIANGTGDFGPITPNTTSFSFALFAGDSLISNENRSIFYEYHHGTSTKTPSASTSYAIGDLTQLFTVVTLLAEMGDGVWDESILEYLPELAEEQNNGSSINAVNWEDVTLGSLAGNMAGIARDSNACRLDQPCNKTAFIEAFANKPAVYLPDTTPIYSHATFQLLAFALEAHSGLSYSQLLRNRILGPLGMHATSLLSPNSKLVPNTTLTAEPASQGLISTIEDLSTLGRALLRSAVLPKSTTRRWLNPFKSTSNLRNSVGRPWEIYHYSPTPTDAITDIFTKSESIGTYSSYFGLVPDYDVGFVILAEDRTGAPDLNAYADMVLGALQQIQKLGRAQVKAKLAGSYGDGSSVLNVTGSEDPGLAVEKLIVNGTNWIAKIAEGSDIKPEYLDFRLYPTNLEEMTSSGKKQAFRGVIQDKDALVDAGTPTCISWQTVDQLEMNGWGLDEFIFELDGQEKAIAVEWPAGRVAFTRD